MLRDRLATGAVTALVVDEGQGLSRSCWRRFGSWRISRPIRKSCCPSSWWGSRSCPTTSTSCGHGSSSSGWRCAASLPRSRCRRRRLTSPDVITTAGSDGTPLFTREAVTLIHERSKGIPRTISVLCDNSMVGVFAAGQSRWGRQTVLEVCRDFDLDDAPPSQAPSAEFPHAAAGQAARPAEPPVLQAQEAVAAGHPRDKVAATAEPDGGFGEGRGKRRFSFLNFMSGND